MKVAIASGKGGTGKTTVALNLSQILDNNLKSFCLLDCDVEEPNCHLFLNAIPQKMQKVYRLIPVVDNDKCIKCGKCSEICQFNAIVATKKTVVIFPELCHSCGGCSLICPAGAISEKSIEIGKIEEFSNQPFKLVMGSLNIGQAISPPLIKEVRKYVNTYQDKIIDCPPGTTCPVIASIEGVDFVVLVTEPTPFGLHDLKLSVEMIRTLKLPFAIVINRSQKSDYIIEEYAERESIRIMTRIPDDRAIAESYSRAELMVNSLPRYKRLFAPLVNLFCKGELL